MKTSKTITFAFVNEDGDEDEGELPGKRIVCPRCDGEGSHVNPNVDGHGISAEEWENDWDDDSRDAYMSGVYDVPCEECEGERVVLVIDEEAIEDGSAEVKALYARHLEVEESLAEMRAEEAAERRMGA